MPKEKKLEREKKVTKAATWNLMGRLSQKEEQEHIFADAIERRIHFMGLQETGLKNYSEIVKEEAKIINLESKENGYRGLAFYISKEWSGRIINVKLVNERIAAIRFDLGDEGQLTVINVYGPTGVVTKDRPEVGRDFYNQVQDTYIAEKLKSSLVFILGDFNSKIGLKAPTDSDFMGAYGKSHSSRNPNGHNLKELAESEGLYLINTHFKLRDTHIATWHGGRPKTGRCTPGLHNQIDYILVPKRVVKLVTDARAITGLRHRSDHAMVVMKIHLGELYKMRRIKCSGVPRRDFTKLAENDELKEAYEAAVRGKIEAADESYIGNKRRYEALKKAVRDAAEEVLPVIPQNRNGMLRYLDDRVLTELSREQRKLSGRIYHPGKRDAAKVRLLRQWRSTIYAQMRQRIVYLEEKRAEELAKRLMESRGNRQLFETQRLMSRKKRQQLRLQDAEGSDYTEHRRMLEPLKAYYITFFNRDGDTPLTQWRGVARPLLRKITVAEVSAGAKKLGNGRAMGPDLVAGEQIKYGGAVVWEEVEKILNGVFETHEPLPELTTGYLYPLNKPDKPGKHKTADMTRPLIFLPVVRKILSNIVLSRITAAVNGFLSLGQHAYRAGRSTTEIVWTAQWLVATAEKYGERIHIIALDLSKAFDSLDRGTLIQILEENELAGEDELRIISYLLSDTTLRVKVGSSISEQFKTSIGTPQGDALSPILFLIYLEHTLRRHRRRNLLTAVELEMAYADDIHYVTKDSDLNRGVRHLGERAYTYRRGCQCAACRAKQIELSMPEDMAVDNMQCNGDKTVHVELIPKKARETAFELLGNNTNPDLEIVKRRGNATKAFAGLIRIWSRRSDIKPELKMKLYNAIVKPHLTYNAGASAYTGMQAEALNRLHRRQLRRLLNVYYPEHISNAEVYRRTKAYPISIDIAKMRWSFLGHALRQHRGTPANTIMRNYYKRRELEGGPVRVPLPRSLCLTTVPRLLQRDLKQFSKTDRTNFFGGAQKLSRGSDLVKLENLAQNREHWKKAVEKIRATAESKWNGKERNRLARKAAREAEAALTRSRAAAEAQRPSTRRQTTLMEHFRNFNIT